MNAEAECVGRRGRESSRAAAPKHGRTPPVSRAASLLRLGRLPFGALRKAQKALAKTQTVEDSDDEDMDMDSGTDE